MWKLVLGSSVNFKFVYGQLYWKNENEEKRGREWPIFLKKQLVDPLLPTTQILNLYISCQNCRVPFDALKEQIEQEMFTKIVHKRVLFQTK